MLRRSSRRLGHQLIKEPLGNEENTYARGRRTFQHTLSEINVLIAAAAAGVVAGGYSIRNANMRRFQTIQADGTVTKLA